MPKKTFTIIEESGTTEKLRHSFFFGIVRQDRFKDDTESHGTQTLFNTVKHCPYSSFGTAVQEIGEEEFFLPEIEGEDAFL